MKFYSILFSAAAVTAYISGARAGLGEPDHETVVEKKKYKIDKTKIEHPKMQEHHQDHLDSALTDHMTEEELLEEFRKADKNHDGFVTLKEFLGFVAEGDDPKPLEDDKPEDLRKRLPTHTRKLKNSYSTLSIVMLIKWSHLKSLRSMFTRCGKNTKRSITSRSTKSFKQHVILLVHGVLVPFLFIIKSEVVRRYDSKCHV